MGEMGEASEGSGVVLALRQVDKRYPGVHALKRADVTVRRGSVHALVGENGAGKSTLLKIVSGVVRPDEGVIHFDGKDHDHLTPRLARQIGIRLVAQERQIAGDLSVIENVLLGRLPGRGPIVDWKAATALARERLELVGVGGDLWRPARELGVAEQQSVEIARALSSNAKLIIFDEPTAALGASEVERLFENIRRLRDGGAAVVFVSHHLEEIFEIADEITVMRDGSVVATKDRDELDQQSLVELMLGRAVGEIERLAEEHIAEDAPVMLAARDISIENALDGVSLEVRAGEIVAVTGALGSGRRELALAMTGILRPDSGVVEVEGRAVRGGPRAMRKAGVVFLPEDRKRSGLMLDLDLIENAGLGELALGRSPLVRPSRRQRDAVELAGRLRIKVASAFAPVRALSGGNQQKVMLARWLETGARVFVFDEPTAGIDVGAKVEIYRLLRELADRGAAIVVFSSELEEIRHVASRVLILRRGSAAAELPIAEATKDKMLSLVMGAA
jgi:ABC-type sugar transport system ATPase subunit